jgi:hypothetical protein
MKKVFIGLLILAAGAATFCLLQKKEKPIIGNNIQKESIIGKWKLDSILLPKDSNNNFTAGIMGIVAPDLMKYHYEFKKTGAIFLSLGDSLTKDSSRYEWNKKDQLVRKEYPADTVGDIFTVSTLNNDSLALQSEDSVILLFRKLK